MRRLRDWLAQFDWGALLGSALAFVFFAFILLPALTGISNYEAAQYKAAQNAPPIGSADAAAWAVADYTKVLAWFTAVLAVVSGFQLWFLRRSDETARIAADAALVNAKAAKQSVDTIPRMERAYLFLDTRVEVIIKNFKFTDVGAGEEDFRSSVEYGFKNHGRTPAIVGALHQNVDYWPKGVIPLMTDTLGGDMPKGFVISGGGKASDLGIRWPLYEQQIDLVKKGT